MATDNSALIKVEPLRPVDPVQVGFYMQTIGSFVQKFNLGGTVALGEMNLKEKRDIEGRELPISSQRTGHIEKSRLAKEHFFNERNKTKLEERLKNMTTDEREELETVSDRDLISWFNRTKIDSKKINTVKTIPGCFYKSRAQGAATAADMDELNKFYKRTLVSCFLVLGHVYCLVQFTYESRLISKERLPRLFGVAGAAAYPVAFMFLLPMLWRQNKLVLERLDSKYTPIWMRISAKASLFGDDDDDDDDEDDEEEEQKKKVEAKPKKELPAK